eukprot:scaffold15284_cov94-Skeletonema_dohrnii-CCMP3373.AAC.1
MPHQDAYDVVATSIRAINREIRYGCQQRFSRLSHMPHQDAYDVVATSIRAINSPEAVDCHIHSVRYDMVLERRAGGRRRCLIRTPTTL